MSEFEKGQIVAYNDCELSLWDIAKKLYYIHSSIDIFLKNYKTGNYPHKKGYTHNRKTSVSGDTKMLEQAAAQCNIKTTQR